MQQRRSRPPLRQMAPSARTRNRKLFVEGFEDRRMMAAGLPKKSLIPTNSAGRLFNVCNRLRSHSGAALMNCISLATCEQFRQLPFHGVRVIHVRNAKLIASLVAAILGPLASGISTQAVAGVLQVVETQFSCCGDAGVLDHDLIFELTSAEINADISAHIGGTPGAGYTATAGAGRFGQVGLDAGLFRSLGGEMRAAVLVASDEFVNSFGGPARVSTQFIIDGGEFFMPFSTNTKITFSLAVGAKNRGTEGTITSPSDMLSEGGETAGRGGSGTFPGYTGGSYQMELSTDAAGALSLSTSSVAGMDLHAAFDGPVRVRIPLSLQTLDLGVLAGGERLLIGYVAAIRIEQNGFSEGETGRFSDPFTLMGDSILSNVTFTPVPEAAALTLSLTGFLGLCLLRGHPHSAATG